MIHASHPVRGWLIATLSITSVLTFLTLCVWLSAPLSSAPIPEDLPQTARMEKLMQEADVLLDNEQFAQSEQVLRTALALDPSNASSHNLLGLALKKQGKSDAAISEYETALALRPGFIEARNNLAVVLEEIGDVREAEGHYLHILRHAPATAGVHLNYALLLEGQSRTKEALSHYHTFVNLTRDRELQKLVQARIASLQ